MGGILNIHSFSTDLLQTNDLCQMILIPPPSLQLLSRLHVLDISNSFLTSLSVLQPLVCLRSLSLRNCSCLLSTEGLPSSLTYLKLFNCTLLEDITSLKNNHEKLKSIFIKGCGNITNFQSLQYLSKVHLEYCTQFQDASQIQHVHELIIHDCPNLTEISALKAVQRLELFHGDRISSSSWKELSAVPLIDIDYHLGLHVFPSDSHELGRNWLTDFQSGKQLTLDTLIYSTTNNDDNNDIKSEVKRRYLFIQLIHRWRKILRRILLS
jgi:hypothetical protein